MIAMGKYNNKSQNEDCPFYEIISEIISATTITIDTVGYENESTDYLIAWFDDTRDDFDFAENLTAFVGIAINGLDYDDIEFIEKFNDVDDYFYLKSTVPLEKAKIVQMIKDKVVVLDKIPLQKVTDFEQKFYHRKFSGGELDLEYEKENQHKIAIPNWIKRKETDDWSNIRFAKFELERFGGHSVYPFVWIQKTKLKKKEN
jgi:hypothetical protein